MWVDWSLVRGKTKVMSQANAAVKTACPQSVFPSCSDSEEGARDVSLSEGNGVTLQQQLHCPTPMATGDCRNGIFRDGEVVQTARNSTLVCIGAIFLFTEKSMACQKYYVYPSGEQITFEYPGFEAMTVLEKYILCKRRG